MKQSRSITVGIATLLLGQAYLPARSQQVTPLAGRAGYVVYNNSYSAAQAEFQALQQKLAANAPHSSAAPPSITGGKILTPTINVTRPRNYIKLSVNISAPGQYAASYVLLTSPSGELFPVAAEMLPPGTTSGTVIAGTSSLVDGGIAPANGMRVFGSTPAGYLEPGTYTLTEAQIMDYAGNTTTYGASQTAALFNAGSITVMNNNRPDYTPPTVTSAQILTRKVSRSKQPYVVVQLNATDDNSGSTTLGVDAASVSTGESLSPAPVGVAAIPFTKGRLDAFSAVGPKQAAGTYNIEAITACDAAGNCVVNQNAGDIQAIFGGVTTFEIVD